MTALQAKYASTPPEPASSTKSASRGAKSQNAQETGSPEERGALALPESILNARTPVTEADFLRSRPTQAQNGFVPQNPPLQREAV